MNKKLYPFEFNGKMYTTQAEVDDVFASFYNCKEALMPWGVYVSGGRWVDPEGNWDED